MAVLAGVATLADILTESVLSRLRPRRSSTIGVLGVRRLFAVKLGVLTCVALSALFSIAGCTGVANSADPSGGSTPASISAPPVSQSVTEGQPASFSVQASGAAPLSYQWRKN